MLEHCATGETGTVHTRGTNKHRCVVRRCTNRHPPTKAHYSLLNSSQTAQVLPMGTSASSWAGPHCSLIILPAAGSSDVDHPSAHTGPGASFLDWTCYLGQALMMAEPCQTSSLAPGYIPCPQFCKHRETHGKHFHQPQPKTQCPERPATTPHIQRPQNLPHPGTAVPSRWQVAGNDSDASPVTRWPQGYWRSEALPESPISTLKNARKCQWAILLRLLWRPRPSSYQTLFLPHLLASVCLSSISCWSE